MILDIMIEDFRQKAGLVPEGIMIKTLATIIYSSIVSITPVRIALMIAALIDLNWATC